MTALGGPYAAYEPEFEKWAEYHWTAAGPVFDPEDYYDRALVYYAAWVRTGNPAYLDRAHQHVTRYRDDYLVPNKYGATPHWCFVEGLACHAIDPTVTPEEQAKSREAVRQLALYLRPAYGDPAIKGNLWLQGYFDARIAGRTLQAYLFAHLLGLDSTDTDPNRSWQTPATWSELMTALVPSVLGMQGADGAIRPESYCGHQANFSTCILLEVLIQYHRFITPDPRIVDFLVRAVAFLKTQWVPAEQRFLYLSGQCAKDTGVGSDSTAGGGDLIGLIVPPIAWVATMTGDPDTRAFAEDAFTALVPSGWPQGSKQFNQEFCCSYRAAALLAAAPTPPMLDFFRRIIALFKEPSPMLDTSKAAAQLQALDASVADLLTKAQGLTASAAANDAANQVKVDDLTKALADATAAISAAAAKLGA
jgi:hypothetical protein